MALQDDLTPTGKAFLDEVIGDGVMPDSMVVIVSYMLPDGEPVTATHQLKLLGMLEMAKIGGVIASGCGPFDPAWRSD